MIPVALASDVVMRSIAGQDGGHENQDSIRALRKMAESTKHASERTMPVFAGDVVFPQFVSGDGWKTTLYFTNLTDIRKHFTVFFIGEDGTDMAVSLTSGETARAVELMLNPFVVATIETTNTGPLKQGWAMFIPDSYSDKVAGIGIFGQATPGRPDFEAVVPAVSMIDSRYLLLFDNTNDFVTSMAIANTDFVSASMEFTVRDEQGETLTTGSMAMAAMSHAAFTLPQKWPGTAGKRGSVEFQVTSGWASAMGLRFNPGGSFTSVHTLNSALW